MTIFMAEMRSIVFIDTEIDPNSGNVLDIGGIRNDEAIFHSNSYSAFVDFLKGIEFVSGHNIFCHDLKYVQQHLNEAGINPANTIDTLLLSPLLFPTKPYHHLLKDDKLQTEDPNNPLNDSKKARELFEDEISAFSRLDDTMKQIFFLLLKDQKEFHSFFVYLSFQVKNNRNLETIIRKKFHAKICDQANLPEIIVKQPVGLAYCLALISCKDRYSITPAWVLKNYPETEGIMFSLRNKSCLAGCDYCNTALDIHQGLKRFFGFDSFRRYNNEPLQENAVRAAVEHKSILAVFPTGGGKSITFQVPALMSGENVRGLTVVISPLQSLMKDQVDNLERSGITEAVTINGLLDPIERGKSFERVENGSAYILYISPESLRSRTIENLLLGRKIVRFVIDEAHCFSSWGQDFRVDYLYIGDFIRNLQEKKHANEAIPVSCFTATAKQKVIEDIRAYFRDKLSLNLELFRSAASRTNLQYKVFEKKDDEEKYRTLRDLIESRNCPTIVYVSRTRKAYRLAERLRMDNLNARPYHGKMEVKEKTANQDAFISGKVPIMVATSAFGMGVDKKDVGMVIHYEISDSLENYIQESGRAGRDEIITADCFVLFNEEDLDRHFVLLNQTRLNLKEIQQIWKAIKEITKFRSTVSNSALEIARKAGWDNNIQEIETRVVSSIAALEDVGYLKRGQNMPRVYADSILTKTTQEAIDRINGSPNFENGQKKDAVRIIKKLISSRSRQQVNDETAESRIDYISDHLGIPNHEVIRIVTLLREEKILGDARDLKAFINVRESNGRPLEAVSSFGQIENFLLSVFEEQERTFHLKELNEQAEEKGCTGVNPNRIKIIINFWAIKNWIKRHNPENSKNHLKVVCNQSKELLREKLEDRHKLAKFIAGYLYERANLLAGKGGVKEDISVEFSVLELKEAFEGTDELFQHKATVNDVEEALFYLSRIEAIKLEGGFLVVYNRLTIDRLERNNKIQYKNDNYQKLDRFYENKIQQIHIVGEYARKMLNDYKGALQFMDDYFRLNYTSFLNRYFSEGRQKEIRRNMTSVKFRRLFGTLSPAQLIIIYDKQSKYTAVAAGPGSGKTRLLVHKLASLMLMEDTRQEQLLMLTFSRAAVTEFKKRLFELIGNAAGFIEIKTFHSYCFDLLGKVGSLEKSDQILKKTIERIKAGEVEASRITKSVLVIDEAQDMDAGEFGLVNALIEQNGEMRVIAVGDDDQNIYAFRGADSKYLEQFINERKAVKYELIENYRSKNNLVEFTNQFIQRINHRLKTNPVKAVQGDNGDIRIVHYAGNNLITPMVNDILFRGLAGTSCVLTKTNEEALQVTGLLLKNGLQATLIQGNETFNLSNLLEIRIFLDKLRRDDSSAVIDKEVWANAKKEVKAVFARSSKWEICKNLIKDFEATSPEKKYLSDFETFIRESRLEDFYGETVETIFVSTIHKAKGREFDQVILLLDHFNPSSDDAKRQLYVAMTRAKRNLTIHLNGDYLDHIAADNLIRVEDKMPYSALDQLSIQGTFKDVWLDYFKYWQYQIKDLLSGDPLNIKEDGCANDKGELVLKFSVQFQEEISVIQQKGYRIKEAYVNFIIFWKKPDERQQIRIILPELIFVR